jgi:multiple sugar transport system ATP-binding protein
LTAQVHVIEPTGADTQVMCKLGVHEIVVVARDRVSCKPGDPIGLAPDMARVHLFDAASGKTLMA